jgi:heme/copper-type cytochrome/quinol oxidase subunit 2
MPVVVVAKPKAEFEAWLAEQQAARQAAAGAAATAAVDSGADQAVTLAKAE